MNTLKALVATVSAAAYILLIGTFSNLNETNVLYFVASGLIGLCIGDLFLLRAFVLIGPARTLMLFGFQPFFLSLAGLLLFQQQIYFYQFVAVMLLVGCLLLVSWDRYTQSKQWGFKGIALGLVGILLDAVGLILTRQGFEVNVNIVPLEGHFYRGLGALVGFFVLNFFVRIHLVKHFNKLSRSDKITALSSSFVGCFLSLWLYLMAIQIGHIGTLAGIAITGPLFAGVIEHAIQRKLPSWRLLLAFLLFAAGFLTLVLK